MAEAIKQITRLDDYLKNSEPAREQEAIRLGDYLSLPRPEGNIESPSFFQASETQISKWKQQGPIGYFDQAIRQDKTEMIPFNPESAIKSVQLLRAVKRIQADNYKENPTAKNDDISRVNLFLEKSEEERIRGFTIGGRITQGVAALPGFMIEFLATGGAATVGKKAVQKGAEKLVGEAAKRGTVRVATSLAKGVAGAAVRTALMPHRVTQSFAERQINSSLELTDKGLAIAKETTEKPVTSFMKGIGDVMIENFSEEAGPTISKIGSKLIPKRLANGLTSLFKKLHPNESVTKLFNAAGYNGFLAELGEERLGAFLRAAFNIEDFGAEAGATALDRIVASIPNAEELLIEAGILAFPGALGMGVQQSASLIRKRRAETEGKKFDELTGEIAGETLAEEIPEALIENIAAMTPEDIAEEVVQRIRKAAEPEVEVTEPSKEIVAEKVLRQETLTEEEIESFPDLAKIDKRFRELKGKEQLLIGGKRDAITPFEIKELTKLTEDLGGLVREKIKRPPTVKKILGIEEKRVTIAEKVLLKERIRTLARGVRIGEVQTRKEIKQAQTKIIDILDKSDLEAKDKAKFIKAIKNVQTVKQLDKVLPEIQERIIKLAEVAEKKSIASEIQRIAKTKIDPDYKEQIDNILEDFDLKVRTPKTKARRQRRAEFVERQRDEGNLDFLPPSFFTDFGKKTLDEMTLGEVEQLRDQISVLITVGATKDRLLAAKGERDFSKRLDTILNKAYERAGTEEQVEGEQAPLVSNQRKGFIEKTLEFMDNFFAAHRKIEFVLKSLNNQEVFEIIQSGINNELTTTEEAYKKLTDAFSLIKKDFKDKSKKLVSIEGIPVELTREQMIGIALNNGNFGNRQRLINGNKFTLEQIRIIENSLTKNEKEFVDMIFEIVDSFFPETVKVTKKLVGIKPRPVEGKYFPVASDKELNKQAKLNAAQRDLFQDIFHITFVERGFTKERVGGRAPLNLNVFDVIFNHIDSVIHYNTMAIPVRDVQKIINNERFKKAISDIMNPSVYNQFPTWLRDIANPRGLQANNVIDKASQFLRHNSTAAILGHRLTVSLLQGGSFTLTINEIGVKDSLNGIVQFYKNTRRAIEFVYSKSPTMKNRAQRFDREIKDFMRSNQARKITQGKKSWEEILFSMIRGVDFVTTVPSWLGAYEKSFNETGNIDQAVEFADGVVRRTQPAAAMENLSAIMRGSATQKLFTSFMTHFSNSHNQLVNAMDQLKYSQDHALRKSANYARAMWWIWIAPALLSGWIRSGFKLEDWRKFAQELILYPFAGMIFIRDIMNSIVKGFDFGAPPGLSAFKELQFAFQGKEGRTKLKHGVKAIGLLTGKIPTQWVDTIDGFIDLTNGETEDFRRLIWGETAIEPVKRGIFKPPKPKPSRPKIGG